MDTLLGQLAYRITGQVENLATEALGYVLGKSRVAREALRAHAQLGGVHLPDGLLFSTQVVGDNRDRPDLVGRSAEGTEPLIIESKFWAGLTGNQPVAYLERLPEGGVLMFIAPAARRVSLWNELAERARAEKEVEEKSVPEGMRCAMVGHGKTLLLTSWDLVLADVQRALDAAGESLLSADLVQLRGLCERTDTEAFLPLTDEELTSKVFRRVVEFGSLVEDAINELRDKWKLVSTKRLRPIGFNGGWGRYFLLDGVPSFLSCDVRQWTRYGLTPIWLTVWGPNWWGGDRAVAFRALSEYPGPKFEHLGTSFPTIPILVPAGVERDRVLAFIVGGVAEVAKYVKCLAVAGEAVAEPPAQSDAG